jgi:hypothetical protein
MMEYDPMLLERIPKEVLLAAQLVSDWFHQNNTDGSICGIGPVWNLRQAGITVSMPGTPAFTVAAFTCKDAPAGTKVYVKD